MDKTLNKWKEKLLDTGKGNRLINFKFASGKNLEIIVPDIFKVYDLVLKAKPVRFFDVDSMFDTYELKDKNLSFNEKLQMLSQEFESGACKLNADELLAINPKQKNKTMLTNLFKTNNLFLEEKGINILYLAFGFLKWKDTKENINLVSPLVLVPLKIDKNLTNKSYDVALYEDEIITNPTLIYKLSNEFNVNLPEFKTQENAEESLADYLNKVSEFVKQFDWSVDSRVALSCFSFTKINIYKDLQENKEKLKNNMLVQKLLNKPTNQVEQSQDIVNTQQIDLKDIELKLHNVVDADSSQLQAIALAKNGESFVLQGPPGTGKSQTITNLIAEFLYDGKKVLFVSEKLAALNVVFNNLKKSNLENFCLELHSHKANKKEVINSLYKQLSDKKYKLNLDSQKEIVSLTNAKEQLDNYAITIHKTIEKLNLSPYQIIDELSNLKDIQDFEYVVDDLDSIDENKLKNNLEQINIFSSFEQSIGYDYKANRFYGLKFESLTYAEKINFKNQLKNIIDKINIISTISKTINEKLGIKTCCIADIKNNLQLVQVISNLRYFDNCLFEKQSLDILQKQINEHNLAFGDNLKNKNEILKKYNPEIFDLDLKQYYLKFKNDYVSSSRIFKSAYRKDFKIIKNYLLNPKQKLKYADIVVDLYKLQNIVKIEQELNQKLESALAEISEQNKNKIKNNLQDFEKEISLLNSIVYDDINSLLVITEQNFKDLQHQLKQQIDKFNSNFIAKDFELFQSYFDAEIFDIINCDIGIALTKLCDIQENIDDIDNFARFNVCLKNLSENNLTNFVDLSIQNNISRQNLNKTYLKIVYNQFLLDFANSNNCLAGFSHKNQNDLVETFKQKDKLKFEISKAEIIDKLYQNKPCLNDLSEGSQVSFLTREAHKKTKHKPIRVLLNEVGELAQQLKPCFLMSPISVSTYLNGNNCNFDVVIFDEASQIFPWDAIGSIYRTKQVIIVGDSKQMPPTNFFNANMFSDEYSEQDEDYSLDFESILDLGLACFKTQSLKWHYRSKTEELIAFSNKYFYDGELVTFPNANHYEKNMGIEYFYVKDAVYNRKTNQNVKEAEKIVDLVFEHFDIHPTRSLGVVAFSISQQNIIEDLITQRREQNPLYEKYFQSTNKEPFFVKNLETVQGDERDTIIFSVGYGKDANGKFIHNFGPINKQGGERRLNVAITRAKYNVKLVASIRSFDIDTSKTDMTGSLLLKQYLHYAEFGVKDFKIEYQTDNLVYALENEVKQFLQQNGYVVDTNLGTSAFKINLAVKNPQTNEYIMAIECDGENYKNATTTRERERLRCENLQQYGWSFYRIWSLDWFLNKKSVKQDLLKKLENLLKKNNKIEQPAPQTTKQSYDNFITESCSNNLKDCFLQYEYFDANEYCKQNNKSLKIQNIVEPLIQKEQPITEAYLFKRLSDIFVDLRITSNFKLNFYYLIQDHKKVLRHNDYYCLDKNISTNLRLGSGKIREIEYISLYELASGLKTIIKECVSINKEGLFKTIIKLLGYAKTSDKIQERLNKALQIILDNDEVMFVDGQYHCNTKNNLA